MYHNLHNVVGPHICHVHSLSEGLATDHCLVIMMSNRLFFRLNFKPKALHDGGSVGWSLTNLVSKSVRFSVAELFSKKKGFVTEVWTFVFMHSTLFPVSPLLMG